MLGHTTPLRARFGRETFKVHERGVVLKKPPFSLTDFFKTTPLSLTLSGTRESLQEPALDQNHAPLAQVDQNRSISIGDRPHRYVRLQRLFGVFGRSSRGIFGGLWPLLLKFLDGPE